MYVQARKSMKPIVPKSGLEAGAADTGCVLTVVPVPVPLVVLVVGVVVGP